jgi:hypothetical protein
MLLALLAGGCSGSESDGVFLDQLGPVPARSLDLATVGAADPGVLRVYGSVGNGAFGVPVSGGHDLDGDGNNDVVLSAMLADPNMLTNAGEVFVSFGNGTIAGSVDTAIPDARVLRVQGSGDFEYTGSEVWLDDITGDGVAELILARQNFTPDPSRIGAGAVTILIGGAAVATQAASLLPIDLANPPAMGVTLITIVGGQALGRLGIWIRTGDVTGDGIADLLIGADQENSGGEGHSGAVYLVRGGVHLLAGGLVDLADISMALPGNLAQILPPTSGSVEFHLGATCQLSDLDGNGRAEVIAAATIERAGASLRANGAPTGSAHSASGAQDGRVYIAWDDNFAGVWPAGFSFALDAAPGATSEIQGAAANIAFGEELLGGTDFDDDGNADLFIGDIIADLTGTRFHAGSGHVIYNAASIRNAPAYTIDAPPIGLETTTFLGSWRGDIASDTGLLGDFDGDGLPDLAFSSPHGSPYNRVEAGRIHIIHGQSGPWPSTIDLRWGLQPDAMDVRISEVHGVKALDVLCYGADAGDYDGDGIDDLIVNEMLGDGVSPGTANTGNVIVISGALIQAL